MGRSGRSPLLHSRSKRSIAFDRASASLLVSPRTILVKLRDFVSRKSLHHYSSTTYKWRADCTWAQRVTDADFHPVDRLSTAEQRSHRFAEMRNETDKPAFGKSPQPSAQIWRRVQ